MSPFTHQHKQSTFTVLPLSEANNPALGHKTACKELDHPDAPANARLAHHFDETELIGPEEQLAASTLGGLLGYERPVRISGPTGPR